MVEDSHAVKSRGRLVTAGSVFTRELRLLKRAILHQAQSALDTTINHFDLGKYVRALDFVSSAYSKAKILKVRLLITAKDYVGDGSGKMINTKKTGIIICIASSRA
ncbi:uncharacterized protein LOC143559139 [Bidens hawaiensis]|uniref:uncharacterized protein LOC143559139 n=1 Tax=Bidens hawaiensis TaxID=980011 RepID=UPI00404AEFDB